MSFFQNLTPPTKAETKLIHPSQNQHLEITALQSPTIQFDNQKTLRPLSFTIYQPLLIPHPKKPSNKWNFKVVTLETEQHGAG